MPAFYLEYYAYLIILGLALIYGFRLHFVMILTNIKPQKQRLSCSIL